MLIWIDGPAGCGKTTTLHMLEAMIGNEKCLFWDSDLFFHQYMVELPQPVADPVADPGGFDWLKMIFLHKSAVGDISFHTHLRELIDAEICISTIVVTMSLINMDIKENLYDYYRNAPSVDFKHVILTASHKQLESRILNDVNREYKEDHLAELNSSLIFLNDHYHNREDIWIDTTDKSPDEVAKEIIRTTGIV